MTPRDEYIALGCPSVSRMIGVSHEMQIIWCAYLRPWTSADGLHTDVSRQDAECHEAGATFTGSEAPPIGVLPLFEITLPHYALSARNRWLDCAALPDDELGVGRHPTPEDVERRRAEYRRMAAHCDGPLYRKSERALTRAKILRLRKAAYFFDTGYEDLMRVIDGALQ